jgi:hypothetical protein
VLSATTDPALDIIGQGDLSMISDDRPSRGDHRPRRNPEAEEA